MQEIPGSRGCWPSQYFEVGDYTRAWNSYLMLVERDNKDVSSWLKIADIASFRQDFDQAIEALIRF